MKILVLGAGAIGGYFGGRLVEAGADVTFLVRPKRRDQLAASGLVIESPLGNARIAAKAVDAGELKPGYEIVLLTCKAYDLDAAMDAIAPAVTGDCAIVPMLNGLAHLDRLDARFGRERVMGGTCHINVTLAPDGTVRHMEPLNRIFFGERDGSRSPRALALEAAFARTSIGWRHSEDILQEMWSKIVFLASLAATTSLFRGNVAEILAAPGGKEWVARCFEANLAIAAAEGHAPPAQAVEAGRTRLLTPGPQASSMMRDMEAGKPVEADHIIGHMLSLARKHGIDDLPLSLSYTHLKAYEARRAAGRLGKP